MSTTRGRSAAGTVVKTKSGRRCASRSISSRSTTRPSPSVTATPWSRTACRSTGSSTSCASASTSPAPSNVLRRKMDDYYAILGVDPGAPTEDIKVAYREKKAALATKTADSGKADAARLNKAWNVLSDPYQRGRYDEQRSTADENGEVDDDADDGAVTTGRPRERSRQQPRTRARELPPPTIQLPAGTSWPENRRRITAMVIDLSVLLLFFIGS